MKVFLGALALSLMTPITAASPLCAEGICCKTCKAGKPCGDSCIARDKKQCGAAALCGVQAWSDRGLAARAMPLTDAEVASRAFSYRINRTTGFEQALWDCERYPQDDRARCL